MCLLATEGLRLNCFTQKRQEYTNEVTKDTGTMVIIIIMKYLESAILKHMKGSRCIQYCCSNIKYMHGETPQAENDNMDAYFSLCTGPRD